MVAPPGELTGSIVPADDFRSAGVVIRIVVAAIVPSHFVALDQNIVARSAADSVLAIVVDIVAPNGLIGGDVYARLVEAGLVVFEQAIVANLETRERPLPGNSDEMLHHESVDDLMPGTELHRKCSAILVHTGQHTSPPRRTDELIGLLQRHVMIEYVRSACETEHGACGLRIDRLLDLIGARARGDLHPGACCLYRRGGRRGVVCVRRSGFRGGCR